MPHLHIQWPRQIDRLFKYQAWAYNGASWLSLSPCMYELNALAGLYCMPRCHFTGLVLACLAHVSVFTRASLLAQPRNRAVLCVYIIQILTEGDVFGGFAGSWLSWFFYKMPGHDHCCACGSSNRRSSRPDLSSHTFRRAMIQAIRREEGDSVRVTGNVIICNTSRLIVSSRHSRCMTRNPGRGYSQQLFRPYCRFVMLWGKDLHGVSGRRQHEHVLRFLNSPWRRSRRGEWGIWGWISPSARGAIAWSRLFEDSAVSIWEHPRT